MEKPKCSFSFKLMALIYKFRDFRLPRMIVLTEAGIKPGFQVLDYGCGPGSYIEPLAKLVGESGKIYALDIYPLAVQMVQGIAFRKQFKNVTTILSDCETGLPDNSTDVILLYDTFHNLGNPNRILAELHRVLTPDGILSFSDHHMKEHEIVAMVTQVGLFELSRKGKRTYSFTKKR